MGRAESCDNVFYKLLMLQGYITEVTDVPSQQQKGTSIQYAHTKQP